MKKILLVFLFIALCFFSITKSNAQCNLQLTLSLVGDSCTGCYIPNISGGTPPYYYLWSTGTTWSNLCGPFVSGVYTLMVGDANGCDTSASVSISINGPQINDITSTPALCADGTASVTVSGGTPPYSYLWDSNPPQTTATATGLNGGQYYSVTVTDSDSTHCSQTWGTYIENLSNLDVNVNVTPDTCAHGVGTAFAYGLSGQPPYTFLWSTGQTGSLISGLSAGAFHVIITDANGCTATDNAYISNYSPLQAGASIVQPSCTSQTGSATLNVNGGTPPYTYFWQTTNPVQITQTATGLSTGNYPVIATDQEGCTTTFNVVVTDNSPFHISLSATSDTCNQHIGTATVSALNGVPPYSYFWNLSPPQTTPVATGLGHGWKHVTVTDNAGCIRSNKVYVHPTSPVSLSVTPISASCILLNDGGGIATATGGTAPYTFSWTGGGTGQTVNNLYKGLNYCSVVDASGCSDYQPFFVGYNSVNPCAVTIAGTVYNDTSSNCLQEAEAGLNHVKISCLPLGGYQWTNSSGDYAYYLPPGTYETRQYLPPWHNQTCLPLWYNDTLPSVGMVVADDFPDYGNALDLNLDCYDFTPAVPGFIYKHVISYRNQGSITVNNPIVKVEHDSMVTFVNSTPNASTYDPVNRIITWNLSSLAPYNSYNGASGNIYTRFQIPSTLVIGSVLNFIDTIFPVVTDTVIYNNYENHNVVVQGPYDPNDISVSPQGFGPAGIITTDDSVLTYLVRFQNTGTYPAQNVIIRLALDSDLDISTFERKGTSDYNEVTISSEGEVEIAFYGINLPDSSYNQDESQGYVAFSIEQKPGLPTGTEITETADIYFDFNAAITTNTVLNTIRESTSIPENERYFSVFPNPSKGIVTLETAISSGFYQVSDIAGKTLMQGKVTAERFTIDISALSSGIYFISVTNGEKQVNAKVVKE